MADFLVLPPRAVVGAECARWMESYLPGISIDPLRCAEFLHELAESAGAYPVFREDLPDGEPIRRSLREGFGAADDDRIVQVGVGTAADQPRIRVLLPNRRTPAVPSLQ